MGHAAWESQGAVAWQPRQLSASHHEHRVLWLEALATCPSVCCRIFLQYRDSRFGCGLMGIWQPRKWKGEKALWWESCTVRHLTLLGRWSRSNYAALQSTCWWWTWVEVHSGKQYRDRAILRLLPDHLLKRLGMIQRLTGCRQMGNLVSRVPRNSRNAALFFPMHSPRKLLPY